MVLFSCNEDEPKKNGTPTDEFSDQLDNDLIGDSQIPYIVVNTNGGTIQNEPKIAAEMAIYENKVLVKRVNIGIEYRGSTSYRLSSKKSFGIETWDAEGNDIDESFFGFPPEEDFILNGHVVNLVDRYLFDRTLMYHRLGYQIYRKMGRYASRTQFVELELDGEYLGVYVFMEKLKRDGDRIDISRLEPSDVTPETISGGYILKIDKTAGGDLNLNQPLSYFDNNWSDDATYNDDISFRSRYDVFGGEVDFEPYREAYHQDQYLETYFLYEYPKADEITSEQKEYIQDYIDQFETALLNDDLTSDERTYTDYMEMETFVDHFILNELVKNIDGYRLSTFLVKERDGKLEMGPVWDLNIGYDASDRVPDDGWVINYNQYVQRDPWMMPFWWPRLMQDPIFKQAVRERWEELRRDVLSTSNLHELVDENAEFLIENGAVQRNYEKWDLGFDVGYEEGIQSLKDFLQRRTEWMDGQIQAF